MKRTMTVFLLLVSVGSFADDYVRPHTRRDGTFVPGHFRSKRDGNRYNNWSTEGNVNPYTGERGKRDPDGSRPERRRPAFGGEETPWDSD